jgi:hypothetical protein
MTAQRAEETRPDGLDDRPDDDTRGDEDGEDSDDAGDEEERGDELQAVSNGTNGLHNSA